MRQPLRMLALPLAIAGLLGLAAGPAVGASKSTIAKATLLGADGSVKGQVLLEQKRGKLTLKVSAEGLTVGAHGIHLHAVGSCNAPDFTSAGPHLNPLGRMHGSQNPQGSHLGDLPNLTAGSGGKASATIALTGTLATLAPQLFDGDGTAVVIHAAADDYTTDPSGNSGGRILCGVLTRIR